MNRNVLGTLIISVFFLFPTLMLFQNCAGSATSAVSFTASSSFDRPAVKVSGGLPVDISAFEFTADSNRLVFLSETDAYKNELFIANRDGSDRRALSAGGAVESFRMRPDGVVYLAEENLGRKELFFVDFAGTTRVNLGGALDLDRQVQAFDLRGERVFFLADADALGTFELFVTDFAAPGVRRKLHAPLAAGRQVFDFKVYDGFLLLRSTINGPRELFAVGFDGSAFTKVSQGGGVAKYDAHPDGSRIVYTGDLEVPGRSELYVTNRAGTGQAKVSQTLVAGGQVVEFALSSAGENVFYLADADVRGRRELYQRDLVSLSAPIKLNPPLVAGGNVTRFSPFTRMQILNGAPVLIPGVAFVADSDLDDRFELFVTTDLARVGTRVNGPMNPGGDVLDYVVSDDGASLAYVADQDVDGHFELYRKAIVDLGVAVKLVGGGAGQDTVPPLGFNTDGRMFFVADLEHARQRQLYVTDAGGQTRRLGRATIGESDVYEFRVSPDGRWIAYAGEQETVGVDELFVVPLN